MKKNVLMIMGLCIMLLAGGCSKGGPAGNISKNSSTKDSSSSSDSKSTDAEVTGIPEKADYKVGDYITLGKYKGVEVTVTKKEVTDKEVKDAAMSELTSSAKPVVDKSKTVVKDGDIVNIDYKGLKDGKAFDGGTDKNYDLTIGSNSFIEGFESGLIGKKVGDTVNLNLTFPKDYNEKTLAGQAVVFEVKINSIKKNVTPELTDSYVKANTKYKSVAELEQAKRSSLESSNEEAANNEKINSIFDSVIKASKIKSIPETLTNYYSVTIKRQYTQEASQYGMDLESYLKQNGFTMDQFNDYLKSYSESMAKQELILKAVAETEKLAVTNKEFKASVKQLMTSYNVKTEKELYKVVSKKQIKESLILEKAYNLVIDNAVVKNVKATPAPTQAATLTPAAK
jgi:trigger factor